MVTELTPNQIVAWNLRRLRRDAGFTQEALAALVSHYGLEWTAFTVSAAERAVRDADKGRRFGPDELAVLAMVFFVIPGSLLMPPDPDEVEDDGVSVRLGSVSMSREEYVTTVLLVPATVRSRGFIPRRG